MKDQNDVRGNKAARSEFSRRGVDLTLADIRVTHGVVHVRGTLQRMSTAHFADLKTECLLICQRLRQKPEIRDVQMEATFRGS